MMMQHSAHLQALMNAAAEAAETGDDARAEPLFLQIVALNPRDAGAWHLLAAVAIRAGRPDEAVERAERAHQLERRNHLYLNTLGVALGEATRLDEAARCFKRALKERPAYAEAHYNLGKALSKLERHAEAEAAYRRALQLDPARADVANNLGVLYCRMWRFEEALSVLEKAIARSPHDESLAGNYALALIGARDAQAAGAFLAEFAERRPESPLHGNFALNLLLQGRFTEGWREYMQTKRVPTAVAPSALAERLPQPLEGSDILLIPEQGIGDHLFFLRFAPALRSRGARVGLIASTKLYPMLTGHPELDLVIPDGAVIPESFARAVPVLMGDLPGMLGCAETPAPFPIPVSERRIADWRQRLTSLGPPPYLALTWRAGRKREAQAEFLQEGAVPLYKEISVEALAPGVGKWRGTLLAIQRAPASGEVAAFSRALGKPLHDLSSLNDALDEMSALLAAVDEYVGVSNTNMHIRAGLGKTARVLIPFPPEFRWMDSGAASPWFPRFRLYRQSTSGHWEEAIDRLTNDLSY